MGDSVVGTEVDGYHIQEVVGKGGMGTVYKAEDVNLSRPVALKRINPSQSHRDSFIHRFRSEAKALARIDSRHIIGVYALRETDIGLLIVMEYVDGGTLKDRITAQDGPLPLDTALPLLEQILRAFDDAHSAGVIHRDIKPQNILLSRQGQVKVTDFGIAKLRRPKSGETVTQGGEGGTLKYMSPEQISNINEVDDRSDLYSIGMTAYEMLAGTLPFEDATSDFDIMQAVVEGKIPTPSRYNADLPVGLVEWIQTATARRQDDRFQSAEEMLQALRDAADSTATSFTPSGETDDAGTGPAVTAAFDINDETILADTPPGPTKPLSERDFSPGEDLFPDTVLEDAEAPSETHPSGAASTAPEGSTSGDAPVRTSGDEGFSRPSILAAGLLVLVLALGGGYWAFVSGGTTAGDASSGGAAAPTLTLTTDPSGATVSVNDDSVGTTPLTEHRLSAGTVALRVRKDGYQELDTVLQDVTAGSASVIEGLELSPKPGRLTVTSTPAGAEVYVDGRAVGMTPLTGFAAEPGVHQVRLVAGDASAERTLRLRPGETITWTNAALSAPPTTASAPANRPANGSGAAPESTSESTSESASESGAESRDGASDAEPSASASEPATGVLAVADVTGGATLVVDGEARNGAGTYTVPAGTRQLTCRHPEHDPIQTTVEVEEGATRTVGCYFEHRLSVTNPGPWSNVVLNGENTRQSTPANFRLAPGEYTVRLSLERDQSMRVVQGTYRLTAGFEGGKQRTLAQRTFSTPSYTFTVEPGFEPRHYVVSLEVER